MSKAGGARQKNRKARLIKMLVLLLFLSLSAPLIQFTALKHYLRPEFIEHIVRATEPWSALVFMFLFVAGTCVFLPGAIMVGLGTACFGPVLGLVYTWIGLLAGANLAFLIARSAGREAVVSMLGDKLKKYDGLIERNGFAAVLYARIMAFPFAPTSYWFGLTGVRFWDHFFGTALGALVSIAVLIFFFSALKEVWASGDVAKLLSVRAIGSFALVLFSIFLPGLMRRRGAEREGLMKKERTDRPKDRTYGQ
jgi:uncharacterized membrane protein YdjX (TVP38/TMEM64 family)